MLKENIFVERLFGEFEKFSIFGVNGIKTFQKKIKNIFDKEEAEKYLEWFESNGGKLNFFYNLLEDKEEKNLFVKTILTKLSGKENITQEEKQKYLASREIFDGLVTDGFIKNLNSVTRKLKLYNLKNLGYDLKVYGARALLDKAVVHNQYSHKNCQTENGDYVIDGGGCWGDTALIFALKAGRKGKVFTFEFFEDNLNILKENFSLNKEVSERIFITRQPLYDSSDKTLFLKQACADITALTEEKFGKNKDVNLPDGAEKILFDEYNTVSIDDFVKKNKIEKIDFIKLDIEGCEVAALEGARETIKTFKPKLAIAAYHKYDDYYEIPKFINGLDLGYKFYFASYTPGGTDTVIYAK